MAACPAGFAGPCDPGNPCAARVSAGGRIPTIACGMIRNLAARCEEMDNGRPCCDLIRPSGPGASAVRLFGTHAPGPDSRKSAPSRTKHGDQLGAGQSMVRHVCASGPALPVGGGEHRPGCLWPSPFRSVARTTPTMPLVQPSGRWREHRPRMPLDRPFRPVAAATPRMPLDRPFWPVAPPTSRSLETLRRLRDALLARGRWRG
jgi:hypothetical protein